MKSIKTYEKKNSLQLFVKVIVCAQQVICWWITIILYYVLCLPTDNEKLPLRSPTSGDVGIERAHYTYVKLRKTINLVQIRKVRDTMYIKILC